MPSSPQDSSDSQPPSGAPSADELAAPRSVRLNVILFALTVVSVVVTGALNDSAGAATREAWFHGFQYAGALLGILVAHESGHYIAARIHKVDASPPFFIPLPLMGFGTMGAVIRMRGKIATRKALLDIGASGPLCGLAVAFPLYAWGVAHSRIISLDTPDVGQLGSSLAVRALDHFLAPSVPEGYDVLLSPVAFGAWAGMLVTMINLLPVGQLDGGHVAYALFGPRQDKIALTVHRSLLVFFFVSLFAYVTRDLRSGLGFSHFGERVSNSLFWLAWFQVLSILGTVSSRATLSREQEPVISIRTRLVTLIGLLAMAWAGTEAKTQPIVWIGFFGGLALFLAMEVRGGVLRKHTLFDHPPTGEAPLGWGRKAVAVLTLAMFVLLFMPTPFPM